MKTKLVMIAMVMVLMALAPLANAVERADLWDYPMSENCSNKAGKWLGFVKGAGYLNGELWGHNDGTSAMGEVVKACANGEVIEVTADKAVIEHIDPNGTMCWSTYLGLVPNVTVGQEVLIGDEIGTVNADTLFFSIGFNPAKLSEKWIKKVTWATACDFYAPSTFIDLRQEIFDLVTPRGTWTQFELPVGTSQSLVRVSYEGVTYTLNQAIEAGVVYEMGKLMLSDGAWDLSFHSDSWIGFESDQAYQIKALKTGVVVHFYQAGYHHMDGVAKRDMLATSNLFAQAGYLGGAKPKTFKYVRKAKAYVLKFQSQNEDWGKQVTMNQRHDPVDPFYREVKMFDADGVQIFDWAQIGQNRMDYKSGINIDLRGPNFDL